jgi:hypothetical protein
MLPAVFMLPKLDFFNETPKSNLKICFQQQIHSSGFCFNEYQEAFSCQALGCFYKRTSLAASINMAKNIASTF